MFGYTKRNVISISLIISIIIFLVITNINKIYTYKNLINKNQIVETQQIENKEIYDNNSITSQETKEENKTNTQTANNKQTKEQDKQNKIEWTIEIPSISLKATIAEGTSEEVMDVYVGHFTETSKTNGNIGLAAHNRGYKVNYFQNLKKLKLESKVIYKYGEFKKTYIVKKHEIIRDTDWSYLEETQENTITLITCVENEPEYRRCIQAIEQK